MSKSSRNHSLICDYLEVLGVPYTEQYAGARYDRMPFQTLFGLSKLLQEYGIRSEGYRLEDKSEIHKITPPFLAKTVGGIVIVTALNSDSVTYLSWGIPESMPLEHFDNVWSGDVMLSYPDDKSCEPDYGAHARIRFFTKAKKWVLLCCFVFLFLYAFITNGIYKHISTVLIALIDLAGLYFTYLLVQKSLKIHNGAADRFCGILQAGGCDSILETKASKFFGLFGWSEVGFSYFSVSLLTLLLYPSMLPWLALCNVCCLPFTFWSIWYQRFKAHKWCTLCVSVQGSLWLLFICYLCGGWLREAWPPSLRFVVLGAAYVGVMLLLNAVMPLVENDESN